MSIKPFKCAACDLTIPVSASIPPKLAAVTVTICERCLADRTEDVIAAIEAMPNAAVILHIAGNPARERDWSARN